MTAPTGIVFDAVTKRFAGRAVLSDLDLTVEPGECVALIGHNGAGKTTLMKLVLGLTRPDVGRVRVGGGDPGAAPELRCRVGYLPENVAFEGGMSGRDTLRFYARLKGESRESVDALLDEVGLTDAARRAVRTYSKGMRQRLGLAQALLGSPRLLVLDEPTTGLDPALRGELYDHLERLRADGVTTLVASHSLGEIQGRADRIAVLRRGRLVAFGTLDALRRETRAPVQIRVSVTPGSGGRVASRIGGGDRVLHVNERCIELACLAPEKMALLRRIAAAGEDVSDVDVQPPTLDEIYRHFSADEVPQ